MLQLAFYKGPPADRWHSLSHRLTCFVTGSVYSHVELVINGLCWSASPRDGGVRSKQVDLTSGRWDVITLTPVNQKTESDALDWFRQHQGQGYDWAGVLRFVLPFLPQRSDQWFCAEAVAAALGLAHPAYWTPGMLSVSDNVPQLLKGTLAKEGTA